MRTRGQVLRELPPTKTPTMKEQIAEMIQRRRSDIGTDKLLEALKQTFPKGGFSFKVSNTGSVYTVSVSGGDQSPFSVTAEAGTMKKAA